MRYLIFLNVIIFTVLLTAKVCIKQVDLEFLYFTVFLFLSIIATVVNLMDIEIKELKDESR
jgi:hypothetical protein